MGRFHRGLGGPPPPPQPPVSAICVALAGRTELQLLQLLRLIDEAAGEGEGPPGGDDTPAAPDDTHTRGPELQPPIFWLFLLESLLLILLFFSFFSSPFPLLLLHLLFFLLHFLLLLLLFLFSSLLFPYPTFPPVCPSSPPSSVEVS